MASPVTKSQFISGATWKIVESFSAKGISFVVSIILARMLMPEDYGLLALTAVFTTFSDMLIDAGFSTALIRKKDVDEYDYSSVLLMSIIIAVVLYTIIFFSAPAVGSYYNEPQLPKVLRVIALILFIQAFNSTRNASIAREMKFKLQFYCSFAACIISGTIGIILAYIGCGVWALVAQQLSQSLVFTLLIFIKIRWEFKWRFDINRMTEMLKFGSGVVGSSFINYLATSISSIVIGKHYSVKNLGYYDKGGQMPMQISLYTFSALSSVLLPTLSSHQSNLDDVKRIMRKVTHMTAFVVIPIMAGLAITSRELILLLLTEKWLPSLKIMQYCCIYYLATPFMLVNIQLFFALGHSYIRVKTEIIRFALICASLLLCVMLDWNMYKFALVSAIIAVIVAWITFVEAKKLINYKYEELFADLLKPVICGIVMSAVVIVAGIALKKIGIISSVILLICKIGAGAGSYCFTAAIIKPEAYLELLDYVKGLLKK